MGNVNIINPDRHPNSSRTVVVARHSNSLVNIDDLSNLGGACEDITITVTPLNHLTLRVAFSVPVNNNFALISPNNYVFTPSMTVVAVTPNSLTENPTYVDLTVSGMEDIAYSLNILVIEAA